MDTIKNCIHRKDFVAGFQAASQEIERNNTGDAYIMRGICAYNMGDTPGMIRDIKHSLQTRSVSVPMQVVAFMYIANMRGGMDAINTLEDRIPKHLMPMFKFARGWIGCNTPGWNMEQAFLDFEDARAMGFQSRYLPMWRAVAAAHTGNDIGLTHAEFFDALK